MTAVLGAGMSGLSAAYYALKYPKMGNIVVVEASSRVGGWIRSHRSPNGIIFEKGPRTIRARGPLGSYGLELLGTLQLTDKVVPFKSNDAVMRNRLIYKNNELHRVPTSFKAIWKQSTLLNGRLIMALWTDYKAQKISKEDESVYSFVERRFGKKVADYLISPLTCGICAGDAKKISVNLFMKDFFQAEQTHGSVARGIAAKFFTGRNTRSKAMVKGEDIGSERDDANYEIKNLKLKATNEYWSAWGLRGGLEQLPQSLANHLRMHGVDIKMEHKCESINFKPNCVELVVNGETKKYDRVISSLPAHCLADLLTDQHCRLSEELRAIPMVSVVVINLQFDGDILPVKSFGVLVPPKEQLPVLGIIFDTHAIPQGSSTVLTVMMGGAWFDTYFGSSPSEEHLLNVAVEHVKRMLRIQVDPVDSHISILKDCIAQYVVGHDERVRKIEKYISKHRIPLVLCGASYSGIGVNDVILSGKRAVADISMYT